MSQDNPEPELVEEHAEEQGDPPSAPLEEPSAEPLLLPPAVVEDTKPPGKDRSRVIVAGAIGLLVAAGIALIVAAPKKSVGAPEPPALTSGDLANDGGSTGAVEPTAEKKDAADAAVAPVVVRPPPVWRVTSLKEEPGVEIVEGTFGKKGLVATLTAAGLTRSEIKRLNKAFEDVKHIDRPGANDKFILAKDKRNQVVGFEFITSPFDVWQARPDPDDVEEAKEKDAGTSSASSTGASAGGKAAPPPELEAKKLELFIEHKRAASAIVIAADLAKTIAATSLRPELVDQIDDALEGHIEEGAIKTGARLRVVASEDFVEGAFARVKLEAVELVPRSGSPLRVYFYERGADVEGSARRAPAAGFYDAKGRQPYHGTFRPPLPLARITSRFNPNRMHPVLHVVMPHNGVDYAGGVGTPIYASSAGTVTTAGDGGPCGNMVQIDHAGGITTSYCHMSKFAAGIHPGLKVETRQLIGYVGQTGRVTGPHLHFVVKKNGVFIDPLSLKMDGVRVLPPADRDAFAKKRGELDVVIDGIALPAPTPGEPAADGPDVDEDKDLHE